MGHRALIVAALAALVPAVASAQSGSIEGEVQVSTAGPDGKASPKDDRSGVLVYVSDISQPPPPEVVTLAQKGKSFVPGELVIVAGQSIDFTNEDPVVHNVFSPTATRKFDLGRKRPGEHEKITFPKPGLVELYCDIHEEMSATVLVLPSKAFARTDKVGRFKIPDLPPGKHQVFAWLRGSEPARAEVVVAPGKVATLSLALVETRRPRVDKYGKPYSTHAKDYGQR